MMASALSPMLFLLGRGLEALFPATFAGRAFGRSVRIVMPSASAGKAIAEFPAEYSILKVFCAGGFTIVECGFHGVLVAV
jgi:hypothetical protein